MDYYLYPPSQNKPSTITKMNPKTILRRMSALTLCTSALGQVIKGADYNKPNGGPPGEYFEAAASIPVAAIQSSTASLSRIPERATYPIRPGSKEKSTIYSDWAAFNEVSLGYSILS
jgi:chitosanase